MMAPTHVFAGLALVTPVAYQVPEFSNALAVGAILGGLAPDVDLVFDHRRSLHFPVLGALVAIPLGIVAVVVPATITVGLATFVVTAWVHAVSDVAGNGPEMDPWTDPIDRAVYDHARGTWIRPRRWIRYDGAPEDALLAVALAIPALVVFDGWVVAIIAGGIAVSVTYALFRRRVVEWIPEWLE